MTTPNLSDQPERTESQIPLRTSGLAIAALVLGILGCIGPLGIIAVIFGIIAMNQIAKPANRLTFNQTMQQSGQPSGAR